MARARRATLLIDGAAYFDAFVRTALRARQSIVIVGWEAPGALKDYLGKLANE